MAVSRGALFLFLVLVLPAGCAKKSGHSHKAAREEGGTTEADSVPQVEAPAEMVQPPQQQVTPEPAPELVAQPEPVPVVVLPPTGESQGSAAVPEAVPPPAVEAEESKPDGGKRRGGRGKGGGNPAASSELPGTKVRQMLHHDAVGYLEAA